MKLDSKQMYSASELFMAAAKAGHVIDLARFTHDAVYAQETLVGLASWIKQADNPVLREHAARMLDASNAFAAAAPTAQGTAQTTEAAPAPTAPPPSDEEVARIEALNSRYVGRLR
jgi:hypothetical protein